MTYSDILSRLERLGEPDAGWKAEQIGPLTTEEIHAVIAADPDLAFDAIAGMADDELVDAIQGAELINVLWLRLGRLCYQAIEDAARRQLARDLRDRAEDRRMAAQASELKLEAR